MLNPFSRFRCAALGMLTIAATAVASSSYSVNAIPVPSGYYNVSMSGINDSGQVVGTGFPMSARYPQPFIGTTAGSTAIPLPLGWISAQAFAINNSGQVVGQIFNGATYQAFIGTTAGSTVIPLPLGWISAQAFAINNSGQVAGQGFSPAINQSQAFIGSTASTTAIPLPSGWSGANGTAINDSGQVAGWGSDWSQVFIGTIAGSTAIPLPSGWSHAYAYAINSAGQVAGVGVNPAITEFQAFIGSTAGTVVIPLPTNGFSAGLNYGSLNDAGIVVGGSAVGGWIWDATNSTRLLNSLVPAGWNIATAFSISNTGLILAQSSYNGGPFEFVILTPQTPGYTAAGMNISDQPADTATGATPVTMTFANVSQAGTTSLTTAPTGPPPPTGFKLGNPAVYYDLSTTAVFSGSITVCVNYAGTTFANPSKIQLFHYENNAWVDITTSVNTATTTVCGSTTSLSPFTVVESDYTAAIQAPISADGSSVFAANRGVVPVKFTLALDGAATCQLPPAAILVTQTAGATTGTVNESEFSTVADSGSNFRIDTTNCQYVYNLGASNLGPVTYKVQIVIDNVAVGSASFGLN